MATADQTVSAVLEATNKAYIVETNKVVEDDGWTHWYRRWSNGLIEQWGCNPNQGPEGKITITFPVPFSDSNYYARPANRVFSNIPWDLNFDSFYNLTPTSADVSFTSIEDQGKGLSYYACGF